MAWQSFLKSAQAISDVCLEGLSLRVRFGFVVASREKGFKIVGSFRHRGHIRYLGSRRSRIVVVLLCLVLVLLAIRVLEPVAGDALGRVMLEPSLAVLVALRDMKVVLSTVPHFGVAFLVFRSAALG